MQQFKIDKNALIVVAMSGGVDSSVAAALLVEQGFRVVGVTMKLWEYQDVGGNFKNERTCCSLDAMNDARAVCQTLGIPHYVLDFHHPFRQHVVDNFIQEYLQGRTPNPCVLCNTKIKWELLLQKAVEFGADFLATGHYARVTFNENTNRYELRKGLYGKKDQSYALWGLTQQSLARTIFPLGEKTKSEVRMLAQKLNLKTAHRAESQEICFIPDNDYRRFLKEKAPDKFNGELSEGWIVTTEGRKVGTHKGYPHFTIGQRKGLGVALGKPAYVVDIIPEENKIVVGDKNDLLCNGLIASAVNLIAVERLTSPERFFVKIRYRDKGSFARVSEHEAGKVLVQFEEPQPAVTPGQSVVFYDDDLVIGGGIIEQSLKE